MTSSLNQSAKSNTVTVTTPADTTPPTAPQLSGTVRGPSQVALTWTRSTDDLAYFVGYRIFANGVQVAEHVSWYSETSVVLRHLTPSTPYTFTIQAHDFSGNASTSNAVTLTTEATRDVTPPLAPTKVRIVDGFCNEFWIGWTQSTDDTDPQSAIEYEIYVNGVLSPLPVSAGGSGRKHFASEQRGDGGLLRSSRPIGMLQGRPRPSGRPCRTAQPLTTNTPI